MIKKSNEVNLKFIFSLGRSGSNFLGSMINSHPKLLYRHEPFHSDPLFFDRQIRRVLSYTFCDEDVKHLYADLKQCMHLDSIHSFDKVFLNSNIYYLSTLIQRFMKKTKIPYYHLIHNRVFTPMKDYPIICKEVGLIDIMKQFNEKTSVPIVFLIRNPFAFSLSYYKGITKGYMPRGRIDAIKSLIQKTSPVLYDEFGDEIDHLSDLQRVALMWRMDTEEGLRLLSQSENQKIATYESLAENPNDELQSILHFFGISMHENCSRHIYQLTSKPFKVNHYFSTNKTPKTTAIKWKDDITMQQIKEIDHICKDSPALTYFKSYI